MGLNLTEAIKAWIKIRENTITEINKTADKLKKYHKSTQNTRIAGASIGAVGIILAPFSGGASLLLTGAALGGAATAIGATIAEKFKEKSNLEHAQKTLQDDYSKLEKITEQLREMKIVVDKTKMQYPSIKDIDDIFAKIYFSHLEVQEGPGMTSTITHLSLLADKGLKVEVLYAVSGGIAVAATTILLGAAAAPIVLVPINLFMIVRDVGGNSESKAVQELRKIAAQLTTDKQNILEQLKFFI